MVQVGVVWVVVGLHGGCVNINMWAEGGWGCVWGVRGVERHGATLCCAARTASTYNSEGVQWRSCLHSCLHAN